MSHNVNPDPRIFQKYCYLSSTNEAFVSLIFLSCKSTIDYCSMACGLSETSSYRIVSLCEGLSEYQVFQKKS